MIDGFKDEWNDNPIEIDGVFYHGRDGKVLRDPYDNEPIPIEDCICAAHSYGECTGGAWRL